MANREHIEPSAADLTWEPGSSRRQEIVATAAAIFARQGVQATGIRQVAEEAGIISSTLYHHFNSKLDIVDEVLKKFYRHHIDELRREAESHGDPLDALRAFTRHALSLVVDYPAAVTIINNDYDYLVTQDRFAYLIDLVREVEAMWLQIIQRGVTEGVIRPDFDQQFFYRFHRDAIAGTRRWLDTTDPSSVETVADALTDLALRGIAGPTTEA